ncbi:hypothetical protein IQ07DRAFT_604621 [Pyrenochaeta sp. DS3sAY3a]|nr:hypothetical protein IQ07DRAFT_604621 [Pyrenochaeta sp. DS3sAY3a]
MASSSQPEQAPARSNPVVDFLTQGGHATFADDQEEAPEISVEEEMAALWQTELPEWQGEPRRPKTSGVAPEDTVLIRLQVALEAFGNPNAPKHPAWQEFFRRAKWTDLRVEALYKHDAWALDFATKSHSAAKAFRSLSVLQHQQMQDLNGQIALLALKVSPEDSPAVNKQIADLHAHTLVLGPIRDALDELMDHQRQQEEKGTEPTTQQEKNWSTLIERLDDCLGAYNPGLRTLELIAAEAQLAASTERHNQQRKSWETFDEMKVEDVGWQQVHQTHLACATQIGFGQDCQYTVKIGWQHKTDSGIKVIHNPVHPYWKGMEFGRWLQKHKLLTNPESFWFRADKVPGKDNSLFPLGCLWPDKSWFQGIEHGLAGHTPAPLDAAKLHNLPASKMHLV